MLFFDVFFYYFFLIFNFFQFFSKKKKFFVAIFKHKNRLEHLNSVRSTQATLNLNNSRILDVKFCSFSNRNSKIFRNKIFSSRTHTHNSESSERRATEVEWLTKMY